jgi:hypothetical protein
MAQSSRHISALRKRDTKALIVCFIGWHSTVQGPNGLIKVKDVDFEASREEIKGFIEGRNNLVTCNGHKLTIPRRTLYRYLEELRNEALVEQPRRGAYRLTPKGMKQKDLTDLLNRARNTIPHTEETLGTFFALGPKERGQIKFIDIVMRVQDPDLIKTIEKCIAENKVPENDVELGQLLSTVIMWHFSGVSSRIWNLLEGKEDIIADIMNKLPVAKDDSTQIAA